MQRISFRFTRVTLLSSGCLGCLGGLAIALCYSHVFSAWSLLLLVPIVMLAFRLKSLSALVLLVGAGWLVGWQRGSMVQQHIQGYEHYYGREVQIVGYVRDDPAYDDKQRLDFRLGKITIQERVFPGQVRVRAAGVTSAERGDTVRVSGKLLPGFGNYQAAIFFAHVEVVRKSNSPIEALRRHFFMGVYNALPEPQASLGLGFLIGLRSQLPDELQEQLRVLALTHIVVASGYNLTILIRLSRRLLARFSKFQAFAGSLGLMVVMLGVTGLSPSMSRAGLVTFLALVAWYYGRQVHPVLLLLLAAAATGWWNPLSLWSDLGWWLSFLTFAGVLLIAPLVTKRLYGPRSPPLVPQIAIETFSAQIMVEPLIMLSFGQFSTLGLVANIVVVPFIPLSMLTTFIAGLVGIGWPTIAGWFALPASVVLSYIVEVIEWLATVPWASKAVHISATLMLALYGILALFVLHLKRRTHHIYRHSPSVVE